MHELSIALHIVEAATKEASLHGGQVQVVHLNLGVLSGVVKDALLSAWPFARANSPLEGAELALQEVAATAYCPTCQSEQEIESLQRFFCSRCGSPAGDVLRGRELEITALEMSE